MFVTCYINDLMAYSCKHLYTDGFLKCWLPFKCRKVEDLQFTAEEAAIDRSDLEVINLQCML